MGVKGKAAAAILILLLFLGSLWLREFLSVWVRVCVSDSHAVLLILNNQCVVCSRLTMSHDTKEP